VIYQTGLEMQIHNLVSLLPSKKVKISEISSTADLSQRYATFIERFQNRKTRANPLCPNIVADHQEAKQFCSHLEKDALSLLDDMGQDQIINIAEDTQVAAKKRLVERAIQCLDALSRPHKILFDLIVTDIFIMPSDKARGGSTSAALGVIWANPKLTYRVPDVVEFLLHETVHHAMFIDELCYGHYDYEHITSQDRWAHSAILHIGRPVDKVLHSLVVAAELLAFRNNVSGHLANPLVHPPTPKLMAQATASLASLQDTMERESRKGIELLLPRAKYLLDRVKTILQSPELTQAAQAA
jgi:hypothetical protein